MSKVDAMRALREAKYVRGGKAPDPPGAAATGASRQAAPPARKTAAPVAQGDGDGDELCGHRNMGGKSCSRPAGHSEKNHRYAS